MAKEKQRTVWLRKLNDPFRKQPSRHGVVLMTPGVNAEGPSFASKALAEVQAFNTFTEDDPHAEHDFGSFELDGKTTPTGWFLADWGPIPSTA